MAERLIARWLEYFPDRTDPKGQDIRPVDDRNALLELFKYFTKVVTKSQMMPTHALDVIFRAMVGRRAFQPMGFKLPKVDEEGELALDRGTAAVSRLAAEITWGWSQADTDWIDAKTGEHLTGYVPGHRFKAQVESIGAGGKQGQLDIIQALG